MFGSNSFPLWLNVSTPIRYLFFFFVEAVLYKLHWTEPILSLWRICSTCAMEITMYRRMSRGEGDPYVEAHGRVRHVNPKNF